MAKITHQRREHGVELEHQRKVSPCSEETAEQKLNKKKRKKKQKANANANEKKVSRDFPYTAGINYHTKERRK